ncbi:hypothetical protein Tco_0534898 [Tanacetum coccineum]
MIRALVVIGGGGIGVVICCRGAGGMVETNGGGKVVTSAAEGVSYTGVRTDGSKIINTGTLSTDGDWIYGTSD